MAQAFLCSTGSPQKTTSKELWKKYESQSMEFVEFVTKLPSSYNPETKLDANGFYYQEVADDFDFCSDQPACVYMTPFWKYQESSRSEYTANSEMTVHDIPLISSGGKYMLIAERLYANLNSHIHDLRTSVKFIDVIKDSTGYQVTEHPFEKGFSGHCTTWYSNGSGVDYLFNYFLGSIIKVEGTENGIKATITEDEDSRYCLTVYKLSNSVSSFYAGVEDFTHKLAEYTYNDLYGTFGFSGTGDTSHFALKAQKTQAKVSYLLQVGDIISFTSDKNKGKFFITSINERRDFGDGYYYAYFHFKPVDSSTTVHKPTGSDRIEVWHNHELESVKINDNTHKLVCYHCDKVCESPHIYDDTDNNGKCTLCNHINKCGYCGNPRNPQMVCPNGECESNQTPPEDGYWCCDACSRYISDTDFIDAGNCCPVCGSDCTWVNP